METNFSFSWDWKEQPPWDKIFKAIESLYSSDLTAFHYEIETGSDEYGLLISANSEYTQQEAFDVWHNLEYVC